MIVRALNYVNRRGKNLAARLVRLTGKAPERIHPKHLIPADASWFMRYVMPMSVVVDFGCGVGTDTLSAAKISSHVVGIDPNREAIRIAMCRVPTAFFYLGDADALEHFVSEGIADVILCQDVIEHVDDRARVFRAMRRVLSPTGVLCITAPNSDTRWRRMLRRAGLDARHDDDHRIEYLLPEFLAELAAAGFPRVLAVEPIVYDTPLAGWIDAIGGLSLSVYRHLARWRAAAARRWPSETTGWRVVAAP